MRRLVLLPVVLATLVAAAAVPTTPTQAADGAVRYVDVAGSDSAAGTAAAPWKTLQHAVDNVGPGDRIMVRPGTYAGMRVETSGAPGAWIRIQAVAPGTVHVDRPGPNNRHDSNIEFETWEGAGTVSYWVITGFEVSGAPNWGIDVRGNSTNHSHHVTVRNNEVHHNGVNTAKTGIFFAFTDHARVVTNHSHSNGEHGVYLSNSGDDFLVRHNRLTSNQRCGLHMNGDLSQGGDGLISNGVVEANWIEGNGAQGCAGVNMDGVTDTTVRNNVIVENHATGIAVFNQDGAQCSRRNQIVNNTIVQADDGRWAIVIGGAGCVDNTIRNNILLTRHPFRGAIEMPTANVPGLDSDYNIVADRFTVDDGNSVIGLAQWQAATGQDTNSFVASIDDVLMAGSYRHEIGGLAEDAGGEVAVQRDHDGVARPNFFSFDIGAYETPVCSGNRATIVGTRGPDTIVGTPGTDIIAALGGADDIRAKGARDLVCAGPGADTIRGQVGKDILLGGYGPDVFDGGFGDDIIRGGPGSDEADGGPGNDDCIAEIAVSCE